ncbi:MAG: alkaline phosphatase D family protein [Planctomycetaceae bacterium]
MTGRQHRVFLSLWLAATICACNATRLPAAHLAMGFRVGEVTQSSAIVWTRVTASPERNWNGISEPQKREDRVDRFVPSTTAIADRQGACPGAAGQVRLIYAPATAADADKPAAANTRTTDWAAVSAASDFTHQFAVARLKPNTVYSLEVQARDSADSDVSARHSGSFRTPADKEQWQDVSFGVVTGQAYWDLDDRDGFHIYPAMQKLNLQFLVPTGDTVYYDSESPRARTVELARFHWHRMYSLPRLVEFHRRVPGYWEKDDHDTWCDDCWPTKNVPWMNPFTFAEGLSIFREQAPMGEKTYRTVRWGRGLQVWLVEGRDFRSPNDMPDGPDKTIWGKEQLDWLKKSILASDADFRILVSPTPIVGPDRSSKADNHSNAAFAFEGNHFRRWTREQELDNFYICCGDRHWQYMSIDPETRLHEFSCGPASDEHAGGTPGQDADVQPFHRVRGGFLSVAISLRDGKPNAAFRHHDVHGKVVHEFVAPSGR